MFMTGRKAWHYVEVRRNVVHIFLQKTRAGQVDVAVYGTVVKSGWGEVCSYNTSCLFISLHAFCLCFLEILLDIVTYIIASLYSIGEVI